MLYPLKNGKMAPVSPSPQVFETDFIFADCVSGILSVDTMLYYASRSCRYYCSKRDLTAPNFLSLAAAAILLSYLKDFPYVMNSVMTTLFLSISS